MTVASRTGSKAERVLNDLARCASVGPRRMLSKPRRRARRSTP